MNYRDKAKQLHENVNHTYDGYNYVLNYIEEYYFEK